MFLKFPQKISKNLSGVFGFLLLLFIFIVYRLPLLGFDILNTDAPRWKIRTYIFSSAIFSGNFQETAVIYHPGVTLMWVGTISIKFYNFLSDLILGYVDTSIPVNFMWLHSTQKFFLLLFLSVFLGISLFVIYKLFGKVFLLIFFFVFTFEPMVLAYTRVFHTDALITFLSFTSVLSLYYSYKLKLSNSKIKVFRVKGYVFYLILSSISTGLALLTKSNALFLLPFLGLVLLISYYEHYHRSILSFKVIISIVSQYFMILSLIFITFILFWPAMWVAPIKTMQMYVEGILGVGVEGGHEHKWFGVAVDNPGPMFYPVVLFIRYTPWILLTSFSGILIFIYSIIRKPNSKKNFGILAVSLAFIILYSIFMTLPTKKIDRYLLPIVPFLSIFSSYFIYQFYTLLSKNLAKRIYLITVVSCILIASFLSTYQIFPNYLAYYSPLAGGFMGATEIINHKWPLGHHNLYTYINDLPNIESRKVFIRKPFLYDPFLLSKTYDVVDTNISSSGDIFVLKGVDDFEYIKNKPVHLDKIIKIGNIEYFWIYRIL